MPSLIELFYEQPGVLVPQPQPDDPPISVGEHWIYRAWSHLLEAEVWWVCCEREVAELIGKGVLRGAIYTQAELEELLSLPRESRRGVLKSIHLVKLYFDGTVIPSPHLSSNPNP